MTPNKIELAKREHSRCHYYAHDGEKRWWSVLDCGTLMTSSPNVGEMRAAGLFMGWEAFPIKLDGSLDTETQLRADTWESLRDILQE